MQHKRLLLGCGSVVAVVIAAFLFTDWCFCPPFDSEKWKAQAKLDGTDWQIEERWAKCERDKMLCSLRKALLRKGAPKRAVLNALGAPPTDDGKRIWTTNRGWTCFSYDLGYCSLADYVTLDLCFDGQDRLVAIDRVQH
jgi:hypothetical protein